MTWSEVGGLALLAGYLAWAVASALGLRMVLFALARRRLPNWLTLLTGLLVYAAVIGIFVGSVALHLAVFGPPNMYGATPEQAWSLIAYTLAPFGLPLFVGSVLLLPYDLANCIAPPRGWV